MEDHINVAIRVRPLNQRELRSSSGAAAQASLPWLVQQDTITQRSPVDGRAASCNSFTFGCALLDRVFDQRDTTRNVYDDVVKNIITSSMGGFNGTIFAYGQTSSGKTHSMHGTESEPGIIKLAVKEMFDIVSGDATREYLIRASFLEIYNEVLRDLLEPAKANLKIHENAKREIFVGDLSEHIVFNASQVEDILVKGDRNRHIAGTNMNERSSRSHTIFRIVIESREKVADGAGAGGDDEGGPTAEGEHGLARRQQRLSTSSLASTDEFTGAVKVSCLNLVDLAGSERVGQTGAEGQRLKEGAHINKSLLSLGTVIARLSEDGGDRGHIPYRDSKLTRILQPSLGGNARTLIICTITPSPDYVDEALSTLKFASRAKTICNKPEVNEELRGDALLRRLKRASELEKEVEQMREIERKKIKIEADNEALLRQLWKSQKERERLQRELEMQQSKVFLPGAPDGSGGARRQTWFPGLQGPLAECPAAEDGAQARPAHAGAGHAVEMDTGDDTGGCHASSDMPGAAAELYRSAAQRLVELEAQNEALRLQQDQTDKRNRDTEAALERIAREHDLLLATLHQLAEADAVPPSPARRGPDAPPRELVYVRRKIRALMTTIEASQKQCKKFRSQRPEAEFLEMELQAARETLAEKEEELVASMRESDDVFAKLRGSESAHAAAEQTCEELRSELLAAREAREAATRAQRDMRAELEREAQTGLATLQDERASAAAHLENAAAAHHAQVAELESEAARQQQELEALQSRLGQRVQDSQAEASAAQASADQAWGRCEELQAQVLAATDRADALAGECQAAADAKAQAEDARRQTVEQLNAELRRLLDTETALQSELAGLQSRASAQEATIEENERAAAQHVDQLAELHATVQCLRARAAEAESEGRAREDSHVASMGTAQAAHEHALGQLKAQLAEHSRTIDKLNGDLQTLAEQHQRAEEAKSRLAESLVESQADADGVLRDFQRAQAKIEQLDAQNADVWERVSELTVASGDLSATISSCEELGAKQASRICTLEDDLAEATDECDRLRLDAAQAAARHSAAIAEADRAAEQHRQDRDAAAATLSDSRRALAELQAATDAQRESLLGTVDLLDQRAADGLRQLDEQRERAQQADERAGQLEASLESERALLRGLQADMAASDQSQGAMVALNADLRAQLEAKAALVTELEQHAAALSESQGSVLREIASLRLEHAAEEKRLGFRIGDLQRELAAAESTISAEEQARRALAEDTQAELACLKQQLSEQELRAQGLAQDAEEKQTALYAQLDELAATHGQATEVLAEAEAAQAKLAAELAQSTDGLQRLLDAESGERRRLEAVLAEHAGALQAADQARADAEGALARLRDEAATAQERSARLEAQVAAAASERDGALAGLAEAQRAVADARSSTGESRLLSARLEADVARLEEGAAQLSQQLEARSAEADALRVARDRLQDDLEALAQRARESQAELEQAMAAMRSELSSKDIALGELEAAFDCATAAAEAARTEARDAVRPEIDRLKAAAASLEGQLLESQATASALRDEAARLSASTQSAREALEQELGREQGSVQTLKGMMTELARVKDDEIVGLEQQLEQHGTLLETSISEGMQKDEAIQKLEASEEELRARSAHEVDELRSQCQELQAKVDDAAALADRLQAEASRHASDRADLVAQLEEQTAGLLGLARDMLELPGCSDAAADVAAVAGGSKDGSPAAPADVLDVMRRMAVIAAAASSGRATAEADEAGRLALELEQLRSLNGKLEKKNDKLRDMYKADMAELHAEGERQRLRAGSLDGELARSSEHAASLAEQLGRVQEELAEHQRRAAEPVLASPPEPAPMLPSRPASQRSPLKADGKRPRASAAAAATATATGAVASELHASMLSPIPPSRLNARAAAPLEADDCPPRKRTVAAGPMGDAATKAAEAPRARSSYGDRRRTRRNQPVLATAAAAPHAGATGEQTAEQCVQQ